MLIAVIMALGSAACFATSSVLQYGAARLIPAAEALRPSLLLNLVHRPQWLLGLASSAAGFAMQGLALHFGSLVLVQPLVLTELLFALPIAAWFGHHAVGRHQWIPALAIACGLGLFLSTARPHGGRPNAPLSTWLLLAFAVTVAVGLSASIASASGGSRLLRASVLAVGAGVTFGLLAAILDSVSYLLAHRGLAGTLTTWQPYLLAAVAPTGEVFAQTAYQAGPITASLPVMYTLEPGTAIAIGVLAFDERITHTAAAIGTEVAGIVGVLFGVVVLGRNSLRLPSEGIHRTGSPA
ncbi:MAG: DMT family transporter [Acidimicrobiaceae bacterium]|nr:DMT family transporter [Acidimicrobiaceae bacterium]